MVGHPYFGFTAAVLFMTEASTELGMSQSALKGMDKLTEKWAIGLAEASSSALIFKGKNRGAFVDAILVYRISLSDT